MSLVSSLALETRQPFSELLGRSVSFIDAFVGTKAWKNHIENDDEAQKMKIIVESIQRAAEAICKTIANGLSNVIKGLGR